MPAFEIKDPRAERATSEQFRLLVQGVIDYAIYMLDLEGRVSTWNPGAERIKGYGADEILGQNFELFYTPEARAAGEPQRALRKARDTGRVEMLGERIRKDGSRFWASVIIDAVYDDEGRLAGFAKITRDITEQREAQRELEQAREALFQAQKMEAIGQLTGGIAHDFNNMLAGIIGSLQLMERRIDAGRFDETRRYIGAALESANRAAALTSRLLAFGRRASLQLRPVDANKAIGSMEQILRRAVGENIGIELVLAPDIASVFSDANQLESALLNLAINARDAMPGGGALTIRTSGVDLSERELPRSSGMRPGRYVKLEVRDTGVGMPPDVLEKAFDPFFTTKPSGSGTGLGLSMVYGFVKQCGGHILLHSAPGKGTTATMFLPAADEAPVEPAPVPEIATGRGETILVVEDDQTVRMLIIDMLREIGYAAHEARDAPEALAIVESGQRIDLLVSDVGLPGMNGRQLAEIVREQRPGLRVLFLTGYVEQAADRAGFLEDGMDMMTKPFIVEALAAKIKAMVSA